MGFEDREYSQEEWNSTPRSDNPVTKWFVILTVALFILQALTVSRAAPNSAVFELTALKATEVLHGQVWRLFTFVLCHHAVDIIGLVFSLLIIWRFGTDLERMYGFPEMLLYVLATTLVVGLSFTGWGLAVEGLQTNGSFTIALGLMALFATHFPRMEVCILPMITIQLRWLVALYALFGLYPSMLAMQAGAGIAALANASGVLSVAFALVYRRFDWRLSTVTDYFSPAVWKRAWRARTARRNLRVYQPSMETGNLDSKVDAILAKIHEHGSESLNESERDLLKRASERYKNR